MGTVETDSEVGSRACPGEEGREAYIIDNIRVSLFKQDMNSTYHQ
jgi:hypothetical protein